MHHWTHQFHMVLEQAEHDCGAGAEREKPLVLELGERELLGDLLVNFVNSDGGLPRPAAHRHRPDLPKLCAALLGRVPGGAQVAPDRACPA